MSNLENPLSSPESCFLLTYLLVSFFLLQLPSCIFFLLTGLENVSVTNVLSLLPELEMNIFLLENFIITFLVYAYIYIYERNYFIVG